jgi:hypothetical protein
MKNIQSTIEGTWIELIPILLTEEQQTLLNSTNPLDNDTKISLLATIKTQREVTLSTEDTIIAESIYASIKPTLKEDDTYQLIAADMTLDNGTAKGILNCRVNGEHKQIRF